jgi:hypothetical protein
LGDYNSIAAHFPVSGGYVVRLPVSRAEAIIEQEREPLTIEHDE